ncbi:endonuclease/exonuclease/phosphatase family protein [Rhodohalobacter barkolensis]|uniref:Secretion system C-terminal sorting domain-containing protein n=1 Tax=Rhodohalobacter barkolensis TaxID=2053187 RepID=A0A2N0VJP4_9BACT|nr:endonuclease/exonuclease/phosphatase family protein [Rhodohalobacter barkolensis]PKD44427.1 hypothetical protein CWD77_02870 [Rhodohalobacter barkolensis]
MFDLAPKISSNPFKTLSTCILIVTLFSSSVYGQILEDFEDGTKTSYATESVNLQTGEWVLDDALLGSSDGDRKNGNQSVRLRDGSLDMNFDFPDGANEVQFYASNAGFSGDTGGVVRLLYSQNQGENWQQVGDNIELTDDLSLYSIPMSFSGDVRFKIEKFEGGRVNIDDFSIEPFTELAEDPTLQLRIDGEILEDGSEVEFPVINDGDEYSIELRITNMGEPDLNINGVGSTQPGIFSMNPIPTDPISGGESVTVNLSYSPNNPGLHNATLTIESNDAASPQLEINLNGEAIDENDLITIEKAREVAFGTRVSIAGRVTVSDEFNGPIFFQDESAGIAAYESSLIDAVERGDSIRVNGPVTEYNPINGTTGSFLKQIAAVEGDNEVSFEIIDVERVDPQPTDMNIEMMNSGDFEGRLVRFESVDFQNSGIFQGESNYTISDASGSGELRIDGNVDDLVGAFIPEEPVEITGVIDRFNGTYQIKPRDGNDLPAERYIPEGDDIDKDLTFDVVTWNIEWFGAENLGPEDNDLQMNNVIRVIEEIDADIFALQEIANQVAFFGLVDSLDNYSGFTSNYSQSQQTAYLFKTSVMDSLDSGILFDGQDSFDWAGRLPLFFEVNATVDGITRRIILYNVHAKAFGDQPSYNRRLNAAQSLKAYLDDNRSNERVIFLGDFNDQLTLSTYDGADESPYSVFLEDDSYLAITKTLEDLGFASYLDDQFQSMIDHLVINENLFDYYLDRSQRVEDPSYIENFANTTSDHAPVWSRFQFTGQPQELPSEISVEPNYPNPFNPTTVIPFSLPSPSNITIEVFDILGRKVATPANNQDFPAGENEIEFNAAGLSSGVYIYRIQFEDGTVVNEKMMLVK